MSTNIVDLPDDCIFIFVQWLTILEILYLRRTCKRMAYLTHMRSVWYPLYRQLSMLMPIPPLPLPSYRLYLNLTRPILLPTSITKLPLEPRNSQSAYQLHLLRGGRWLIEVECPSWRVSLRDLGDTDTKGREVLRTSSLHDEDGLMLQSSAVVISPSRDKVYVMLHGLKRPSISSLNYNTKTYVVTASLPTVKRTDPINYKTRCLPSFTNIGNETSPVDMNGKLMSFYVTEKDYICVLDWTYTDKSHKDSVKGVVMCSSLLSGTSQGFLGYHTRVLEYKDYHYIVWIASDGRLFLYLVPALVTARTPKDLSCVQVVPIAQHILPAVLDYDDVSPWSTPILDAFDPSIHRYTLAIWTAASVYTLTLTPSRISHSSDYNHIPTLSRSAFRLSSTPLPLDASRSAIHRAVGSSGTRAVYIERLHHDALCSELAVFSGPFRNIFGESHLDDYTGAQMLPQSPVSRRIVLPGIALMMKRTAEEVVFDEYSGIVCLRHAKRLSIFEFAP